MRTTGLEPPPPAIPSAGAGARPPKVQRPQTVQNARPRVPADMKKAASGRLGKIILLGVVLLVLLTAGVFAALPNLRALWLAPSAESVEKRLNEGNPSGSGDPYTIDVLPLAAATTTATSDGPGIRARVEPSRNAWRVDLGDDGFRQNEGAIYAISDGSRTERYRDYLPKANPLAVFMDAHFNVTSRDGRAYHGDYLGTNFTLTTDRSGRFTEMTFEPPETEPDDGFRLVWSYEDFQLPRFPDSAPRGRCDLTIPPSGHETPNALHRVELDDMRDAVKPIELELRFVSQSNVVLRSVRFGAAVLDESGFQFRWVDVNQNELVDSPDNYQYMFPSTVDHVRVYDLWPDAYVDALPRVSLPGPGAGLAILVALAGAACVRRLRPPV